jgi:hypothetical protein
MRGTRRPSPNSRRHGEFPWTVQQQQHAARPAHGHGTQGRSSSRLWLATFASRRRCETAMQQVANRCVGGSITRPADFPPHDCSPYSTCTRTTRKFGICPSFKDHSLSPRAKHNVRYDSQCFHRCNAILRRRSAGTRSAVRAKHSALSRPLVQDSNTNPHTVRRSAATHGRGRGGGLDGRCDCLRGACGRASGGVESTANCVATLRPPVPWLPRINASMTSPCPPSADRVVSS